ncbi:MAG: type II toxin-antitoxin system Phd/YefM family antitoxin [Alphaproteobacteria bacterium]|nr:type II toxin-antitoxin system Phd/YefM family antitoxin [Alphaproteobacteria bacterium]
MAQQILSSITASITEFRSDPMRTLESAGGEAIAILNRNKPAFYCVPADVYAHLLEAMEDIELAELVRKRAGQKAVAVKLDDL